MRCERCSGTCFSEGFVFVCWNCGARIISKQWYTLQHIQNRIDERAKDDLLCSESPRQKQIYKCKEGPFASCAECKQTAKEWLDE